jgi:hypothetical protein
VTGGRCGGGPDKPPASAREGGYLPGSPLRLDRELGEARNSEQQQNFRRVLILYMQSFIYMKSLRQAFLVCLRPRAIRAPSSL